MKLLAVSGFRSFISWILAVLTFLCNLLFAGGVNTVKRYNAEKADYTLTVDASEPVRDISDMLYGIFFEDINFAADGGLYAEKVVNRSFEFTGLAKDGPLYGWRTVGDASAEVQVDDRANALNENNTSYLLLKNESGQKAGVENVGFLDGIAVKKGETYNFSVYAKALDGYAGGLTVRIVTPKRVTAEATVGALTDRWQKYELTLTPRDTANENVTIQVLTDNGAVALDMVSLFPKDTYKGEENGLRRDIAELLEGLTPKFLRFPGGCVIEGYNRETAYSWKDSVGVGRDGQPLAFNGKYGDVAARKQGINIWTDINATADPWPCFMTYGLGFYEYFRLAEDIGAVGVPVLNCGLYCQARGGQSVPMDSELFASYIQDMLDLVEFCRGDASTTWGKVRADLGHAEPFTLKYICIGNENEGPDYFERYSAFLQAFNKAKADDPELYEGLELIYSSGMDDGTSGANYLSSYEYAKEQLKDSTAASDFAGATDHHYYNDPEWFFENADYYDEANYKRDVASMTDTPYGGALSVFLGEYASWSNNLYSALSEAAYMTGLERNGDIVRMATYAPLLGNETARHWAPDLIWFDNQSVTASINYYMQKLFANNAGTKLLSSELTGAAVKDIAGKVGVGTWNTVAEFDNVQVVDNKTGETLGSDDFSGTSKAFKKNWTKGFDGDFSLVDGKLRQSSPETGWSKEGYGTVLFYGDQTWTNYTYTVDAVKLDGAEGFIIPFGVGDTDTYYMWNIGGWDNTVSTLQRLNDGVKSGQIVGTTKPFTAETGKTYALKVEVDGTHIRCYIDGELYIDYESATPADAEAYQVVSTDKNGNIIIKLVNATGEKRTFAVAVDGAENLSKTATVSQVKGDSLTNDNVLGEKEDCTLKTFNVPGIKDRFNFTAPPYSATVLRLTTK